MSDQLVPGLIVRLLQVGVEGRANKSVPDGRVQSQGKKKMVLSERKKQRGVDLKIPTRESTDLERSVMNSVENKV